MARYTEAKCRLCRRAGVKLNLKGARCEGSSCAMVRRAFPPGQHGQNRPKVSTYGKQLCEKQKVKRIYGVLERQFRRYFQLADRYRGVTGTVLLQLLESRLDNLVYRLGLGLSRNQARQLVRHGHITVNGRKVDIPSYRVKPGQEISVREDSRNDKVFADNFTVAVKKERPSWLEWNPETMVGRVLSVPPRELIPVEVNEQLIVELYSK